MDFVTIPLGITAHNWKTVFSEESFAFSLIYVQGTLSLGLEEAEPSPTHRQGIDEGRTGGLGLGVWRLLGGGHLGVGF